MSPHQIPTSVPTKNVGPAYIVPGVPTFQKGYTYRGPETHIYVCFRPREGVGGQGTGDTGDYCGVAYIVGGDLAGTRSGDDG